MKLQNSKKAAVDPSPNKTPAQLSFLPGLGLASAQKADLQCLSSFSQDNIVVESGNIYQIKKRTFTRKHRKPIKSRVEEMVAGVKDKGKGQGRTKGKGKAQDKNL